MVKKDPAQGQRATRWGSKWVPVSEDACDSRTVTWDRLCSQFQAAADVHRPSSVPLMLLSFEADWEMSCSSARSKSDPGLERFPSRQLKIVFSLAESQFPLLLLNSTWNSAHETHWVKNETFKNWKNLRWCQRGRCWKLTLQRALCHTCFLVNVKVATKTFLDFR